MLTFWIIIGVVIAAFVTYAIFYKQGKINDADKDFIPDEVEEVVEDIKETAKEVKRRAKRVKEELSDVKASAKEIAEEVKDVVDAASGKSKKRRGRPRKQK